MSAVDDIERAFRDHSAWQKAAFKRMKQGRAWTSVSDPRILNLAELGTYESGFAAGQAQTWAHVEALAQRNACSFTLHSTPDTESAVRHADPSEQEADLMRQIWRQVEDFARGRGTPSIARKLTALTADTAPYLAELQAIAR